MGLNDDLKALARRRMTEERVRLAYEAVVDQLGRAETGNRALKVGDRMPSFVLPNAEGKLVFSDDLLEHGPLVVTFFRGNWCPYCRFTLEAIEQALPRIAAAGGGLLALTPDTGRHLMETKRRLGLSYQVLSDVDGAIGLQFGVLFRLPEPYRMLLADLGVDLGERHGNDASFLPLPATYIVDRAGVVRYAFVDVDFTRRAEPDEIVELLQNLKSKPS